LRQGSCLPWSWTWWSSAVSRLDGRKSHLIWRLSSCLEWRLSRGHWRG
jgi:hypothetical protein